MEDKLMNGKLLEALQRKLEDALLQKRLSAKDRMYYETLQLLTLYIGEDHPKVKEMYNAYKPMAWAFLIIGSAILVAVSSGRMYIGFVR